jgi:hypothetical protein
MKNFKEYLEEGRDAPLYHGTNHHAALQIVKSNTFLSNIGHKTISFTRKFNFAKNWAGVTSTVVFELDQRKLAQRYKIEPYNYFNDIEKVPVTRRPEFKSGLDVEKENEYEERIYGTVKNADKYIKAIHLNKISYMMLQKANDRDKRQFYNELLTHKLISVEGVFVNA